MTSTFLQMVRVAGSAKCGVPGFHGGVSSNYGLQVCDVLYSSTYR
jgi:hypothetical protein